VAPVPFGVRLPEPWDSAAGRSRPVDVTGTSRDQSPRTPYLARDAFPRCEGLLSTEIVPGVKEGAPSWAGAKGVGARNRNTNIGPVLASRTGRSDAARPEPAFVIT